MTQQRISDTGFLTCGCGCIGIPFGIGLGLIHGLTWGAILTGFAGMLAGGLFGASLGWGLVWLRWFGSRDERRAQREREERARQETEMCAKRGIAEKGYSWEIPTLCPGCGKAQPTGRTRCSECGSALAEEE